MGCGFIRPKSNTGAANPKHDGHSTWSNPDYSGPYMSTDKKYYQPVPKEAFPKPAGSVRYGTFCDRCKTVDLYEKRKEWVKVVMETADQVITGVLLCSVVLAFSVLCLTLVILSL